MGAFGRLISVALLGLLLAGCGRGADDTVEDFFNDIDKGDLAAATALFSPELHKKFGDEELAEAVKRWSRELEKHQGLDGVSLTGGVVTFNQLALYDVTLSFKDGTGKTVQASLVQVDGVWYINSAL
jgi:hypothetical protein